VTTRPFAATVGAAVTSRSHLAVAICYHFIRSSSVGHFRLRAHERVARFEEQVANLSKRYAFVRGRDLFEANRDDGRQRVLVTFDDGARDVFEHALPILQRYGATATAYICSRPYVEKRLLQIQKVEYLISKLGLEAFQRAFYEELERRFPDPIEREPLDFAGGYRFYRYDEEPIRRFKLDLNYQLPYANVAPVLDALFENVFGPGSEAEAVRETYMSLDELRRLQDAGVELGTHTHGHRVLPRLSFADQKCELETGAAFVAEITGESRVSAAYPFGFNDADTRKAAAELDLIAGFASERRWITQEDIAGRWAIPRYDVNDCFDRSSNALMEGVFGR
jgi:peptidoglycan/xylan/chitin deacetylase (PgdA/CDA1 family)